MRFQEDRTVPGVGGPGNLLTMVLDLVAEYGGRGLLLIMLGSMALVFRRNLADLIDDLGKMISGGGPEVDANATGRAGGGRSSNTDEAGERFEGLPEMTNQMIEDVREYAAENPARVAEVVQSWLYEPERNH
jgi:flagellar biosynthesis/type III secretory pathway M-ring protein FliF/YscJ